MPTSKNKRPRTNKKKKMDKVRNERAPRGEIMINRSPYFSAPRYTTTLRFDTSGIANNVGAIFGNVRYVPTYAYDVDPVLGSTAMPGFALEAAKYARYRVNAFQATYEFANKETFPVRVYACPVNSDPGSNSASYQKYLSNPRSKSKMIGGAAGNNITKIVMPWTGPGDFGAVRGKWVLDTYVGSTSGGSPGNNIWSMVGYETDGSNSVNGVFVSMVIMVNLDFFELLSPVN